MTPALNVMRLLLKQYFLHKKCDLKHQRECLIQPLQILIRLFTFSARFFCLSAA